MKRGIAYVLLLIFGLQSCTVYRKAITPLPQAVDKGKVRLATPHRGKARKLDYYSYISYESDSVYYGVKRNGDRVLLTTEQAKLGDVDRTSVFKNVIYEDSLYYGIKENGDRVMLTDEQVTAGVQLKNKPASTALSIVIPVAVGCLLTFIVAKIISDETKKEVDSWNWNGGIIWGN